MTDQDTTDAPDNVIETMGQNTPTAVNLTVTVPWTVFQAHKAWEEGRVITLRVGRSKVEAPIVAYGELDDGQYSTLTVKAELIVDAGEAPKVD